MHPCTGVVLRITGAGSQRIAPHQSQRCQGWLAAHSPAREQGSSQDENWGHTSHVQDSQRVATCRWNVCFGYPGAKGPSSFRTIFGMSCLLGHGSVDNGILNIGEHMIAYEHHSQGCADGEQKKESLSIARS
mgnify:CR=1 FL=1